MRAYASSTSVPVERTRAEIDLLLTKNGAGSTAILNDAEKNLAAIAFEIKGARYRLELPLPTYEATLPKSGKEPRGWFAMNAERRTKWRLDCLQQQTRTRWRAVFLLLKSKLEIVRIGLSSVEREFMADMVLPGGATVFEALPDAIRRGFVTGDMKRLGS